MPTMGVGGPRPSRNGSRRNSSARGVRGRAAREAEIYPTFTNTPAWHSLYAHANHSVNPIVFLMAFVVLLLRPATHRSSLVLIGRPEPKYLHEKAFSRPSIDAAHYFSIQSEER